jgi:cyanate lyase
MIMKTEIKVHMMHERGESFKDIAKKLGGMSAYDAALMFTRVEAAKERARSKEKVVYRKRLSNVDVKIRHDKLVNKMKELL